MHSVQVLLQAAFRAWKESLQLKREDAAVERAKQRMDSAKEAQMQKLMAKFAGDQKGLVCRKVLATWRKMAAAERASKANPRNPRHFDSLEGGSSSIWTYMRFQY